MARAKRPASRCLAAAALVFAQTLCTCQANTVCRYGEEPGVWDRKTFQILDRDCQLVRYVDHIKGKAYQKEVAGEILFVGDSLNRNLILDVGNELEAPAVDYTPIPYDDRGRPEKIGRNAIMKLGTFTAANIFHFGAHEKENHWLGPARAGISGMHNSTYGRICLDAPRYLQKANVKKDPYMIVINSNYWDAMHFSHSTAGPPPKKNKPSAASPVRAPATGQMHLHRHPGAPARRTAAALPPASKKVMEGRRALARDRVARGLLDVAEGSPPAWEGQVDEPNVDGNITMLLDRQVDAIRDLVDIVKRCYPGTKLFCWHTAPSVGTDNRNPHWFDKRPHVVAALNAAGRFVAKEKGLCLLDWERMFQGWNDNEEWVPDGLHPASHVSREFINLAINVMMEHQGIHHGLAGTEEALIKAMSLDSMG